MVPYNDTASIMYDFGDLFQKTEQSEDLIFFEPDHSIFL